MVQEIPTEGSDASAVSVGTSHDNSDLGNQENILILQTKNYFSLLGYRIILI